MKSAVGDVRLKNGETLSVSCVLGPDEGESGRLAPFLGHKGGIWTWHIEKALREPLDDLETRFYIGEIGGQVVGSICTFENGGVGILGHVYTHPDHRQKGIAHGIMNLQMEDFRKREGKFLSLGTGYGSNAYKIYESFGFRSIEPGSGTMTYSAGESYLPKIDRDLEERLRHRSPDIDKRAAGLEAGLSQLTRFAEGLGLDVQRHVEGFRQDSEQIRTAAGLARTRSVTWGIWPRLNLLLLRPGDPILRNLIYGCLGMTNFEGDYLQLMQDRDEGKLHSAYVYVTEENLPVGFATIFPAPRWPNGLWHLDLFLHPLFESQAKDFLASFTWPKGKVICHVESGREALNDALDNAGFRHEGTLKRHFHLGDVIRDVELWAKDT